MFLNYVIKKLLQNNLVFTGKFKNEKITYVKYVTIQDLKTLILLEERHLSYQFLTKYYLSNNIKNNTI